MGILGNNSLLTLAVLPWALAKKTHFFKWGLLICLLPTLYIALFGPIESLFWRWLLSFENGLVEITTFLLFSVSGLVACALAVKGARQGDARWVTFGLVGFGAVLLFIGLEEVSWGQKFFKWEAPEILANANAQNETTLHNLHFFQGKTEVMRAALCLGLMLGGFVGSVAALRPYVMPRILVVWFGILLALALIELSTDFLATHNNLALAFRAKIVSEVQELFIVFGIVAYLSCLTSRYAESVSGDMLAFAGPESGGTRMGMEGMRGASPVFSGGAGEAESVHTDRRQS